MSAIGLHLYLKFKEKQNADISLRASNYFTRIFPDALRAVKGSYGDWLKAYCEVFSPVQSIRVKVRGLQCKVEMWFSEGAGTAVVSAACMRHSVEQYIHWKKTEISKKLDGCMVILPDVDADKWIDYHGVPARVVREYAKTSSRHSRIVKDGNIVVQFDPEYTSIALSELPERERELLIDAICKPCGCQLCVRNGAVPGPIFRGPLQKARDRDSDNALRLRRAIRRT